MRNFGGVLILVGIVGFFYCSAQMDKSPAVPAGTETIDALHSPAGRYEALRYAAAVAAAVGVLLALFPKGR